MTGYDRPRGSLDIKTRYPVKILFLVSVLLPCLLFNLQCGSTNNGENETGEGENTAEDLFGEDGIVTADIGGGNDGARALALTPDGKILVGGWSHNGNDYDFALVCYNENGSRHYPFGNYGIVTTDFHGEDDGIFDIAVQDDGTITAVGFAKRTKGSSDFTVARYNSDGSLHSSYSMGVGHTVELMFSVLVQPDGKILVAGVNEGDEYLWRSAEPLYYWTSISIFRFDSSGGLDETFGDGGRVTVDRIGSSCSSPALALQPDGKILISGAGGHDMPCPSNHTMRVQRYNTDGSPDTSFGSEGSADVHPDCTGDWGTSLAIQPDGKILIAGFGDPRYPSWREFEVGRFDSQGNIDEDFGVDGRCFISIGQYKSRATSVVPQPDGKIIVGGCYLADWGHRNRSSSEEEEEYFDRWNFAAIRLNQDGSHDPSFGTDGTVIFPVLMTTVWSTVSGEKYPWLGGAGQNYWLSVPAALGPDGSLYMVGYTGNGSDDDFALARYLPDDTN